MFVEQIAHVGLAERDWDSVYASVNARAKVVCLEGILGTKFACTLSDWAKLAL